MRRPRDGPSHADLEPETTDPFEPELGSLPSNGEAPAADDVAKTGTTTVGIATADGVLVATDQRASLGGRFVANKDVQKVEQVHPTAAITLVGSVGGAQSFIRVLRAEASLYENRRGKDMSIQALGTLAGNLLRGGPFFAINPILGGVDEDGHHVYTVDPAGGVLQDDYAVTGSGMQLAYGVLERAYEDDLSTDDARSAAARAIDAASERDTGSGNGIYLAEITAEGVDIEGQKDYDELL